MANLATISGNIMADSGTALTGLQPLLTNPVTGTGTTNYLPKFTAASTIGNSLIYDNGTNVIVGSTTANSSYSSGLQISTSAVSTLEVRGSTQSTLALTQSSGAASSTYPIVEIFNSYNFGIKYYGGSAFSNYPFYYYAGNSMGTGDYIFMQTAGNERLRINNNGTVSIGNTNSTYNLDVTGTGRFTADTYLATASGNVGVGTVSPLQTFTNRTVLTINGTSSTVLNFGIGGILASYIYATSSGSLFETIGTNTISASGANFIAFNTNGSERMRITSGGNVGIGTTSPASQLEVTSGSSGFRFFTSTSTQAQMNMLADLGSGMDNAAALFGVKESTNNAYLSFWNKTAGSMTEKMRITSGGNVLIGTTTESTGKLQVAGGIYATGNISSTGGSFLLPIGSGGNYQIYVPGSNNLTIYNSNVGNIGNFNYTTGAYTATSDFNLKKNIIDAGNSLDIISKIKVRSYDWKLDDSHEPFGVIAQELYEIAPTYVSKPINKNDNWGVSKAELVPMLVKAIQEIVTKYDTKIAELQERILILEK